MRAVNSSPAGTAAIFDALGGGKILSGRTTGFVEKFSVDASGNLAAGGTMTGTRLISTIPTGTAPLAVSSNTRVPSLNADLLDGFHASAFQPFGAYATVGANSFTGDQTVTGSLTTSGSVTAPTVKAANYQDMAGNPAPLGVNGVKEFFADGTLTVAPGITHLMVEMWGGGGAGSPPTGCDTTPSGGATGGGGAYTRTVITVVPGAMYSVVVGAGGVPSGGNGGTTEILDPSSEVLALAGGGQGGQSNTGGAGGQSDPNAMISHPGFAGESPSAYFSMPAHGYASNLAPNGGIGGVSSEIADGGSAGCSGSIPVSQPGKPGYILINW